MAMRNTLDRYWKLAEFAPHGIALQVQVMNAAGDLYVLPFPCKLTAADWVNAITGTVLVVKPRTLCHERLSPTVFHILRRRQNEASAQDTPPK